MPSSNDDIREQEEDIFEELGSYDFQNMPSFGIKEKARKQLAVSQDSPFNTDYQTQFDHVQKHRMNQERAQMLSEETKEIRRQLNLVKSRLSELKQPISKTNEISQSSQVISTPTDCSKNQVLATLNKDNINNNDLFSRRQMSPPPTPSRRRLLAVPNYTPSTLGTDKQQQQQNDLIKGILSNGTRDHHLEAKFRPLTGKADCPNCNCDRRSSVCDQCVSISLIKPFNKSAEITSPKQVSTNENQPPIHQKRVTYLDDERPIRPAKERTLAKVEAVDEIVVPSRVYTIGKSLNDKRTKLAQAIDDLQRIMEQVKEKGNKLEKERKVVQLYKDQWKYGPSIGGPSASSRERLGSGGKQRNYESRLDANLRRDSNSLMGYKDVEPVMKLRQYKPIISTRLKSRQPQRITSHVNTHTRSKSLESLKSAPPRTKPNNVQSLANFQNGKPSSELNLASTSLNLSEEKHDYNQDEDADESSMPEAIRVVSPPDSDITHDKCAIKEASSAPSGNQQEIDQKDEDINKPNSDTVAQRAERIQKMTWIPVFGETEIKTVAKKQPKRKLQIVKPTQNGSKTQQTSNSKQQQNSNQRYNKKQQQQQSGQVSEVAQQKPKTNPQNNTSTRQSSRSQSGILRGANSSDRLIDEAKRRLKFASDLLEQEKVDSSSKNQLLVKRPIPRPRLKKSQHDSNDTSTLLKTKDKTTEDFEIKTIENSTTSDQDNQLNVAIKEIARLEEMVNGQQRLLDRLSAESSSANDHRHLLVASPLTVSCSSPCCHLHTITTSNSSQCSSPRAHHSNSPKSATNRTLITSLRERLNRTKMRLAKTLEEEREKHQQLKLKVDSSLRKQSDLENENELLKSSLSKCIDTCLKDISNTFESLSDTLADSMTANHQNKQFSSTGEDAGEREDQHSIESRSVLTSAAQLINDNKHLKQMRTHIESIELQRKSIFDELSREKQRSTQLELQLKESQNDLNHLLTAKQKLESQLHSVSDEHQKQPTASYSAETDRAQARSSEHVNDNCHPHLSQGDFEKIFLNNSQEDIDACATLDDATYSSVDVYRRYIQSISPDIESLRRERKQILSEFDNIKKMLTGIDN